MSYGTKKATPPGTHPSRKASCIRKTAWVLLPLLGLVGCSGSKKANVQETRTDALSPAATPAASVKSSPLSLVSIVSKQGDIAFGVGSLLRCQVNEPDTPTAPAADRGDSRETLAAQWEWAPRKEGPFERIVEGASGPDLQVSASLAHTWLRCVVSRQPAQAKASAPATNEASLMSAAFQVTDAPPSVKQAVVPGVWEADGTLVWALRAGTHYADIDGDVATRVMAREWPSEWGALTASCDSSGTCALKTSRSVAALVPTPFPTLSVVLTTYGSGAVEFTLTGEGQAPGQWASVPAPAPAPESTPASTSASTPESTPTPGVPPDSTPTPEATPASTPTPTPDARIEVSHTTLDFGNVDAASPSTRTLVLSNTGNAPASLTLTRSGDGAFSFGTGTCGANLAPQASCSVVVDLNAALASSPRGTVTVASAAATAQTLDVALLGEVKPVATYTHAMPSTRHPWTTLGTFTAFDVDVALSGGTLTQLEVSLTRAADGTCWNAQTSLWEDPTLCPLWFDASLSDGHARALLPESAFDAQAAYTLRARAEDENGRRARSDFSHAFTWSATHTVEIPFHVEVPASPGAGDARCHDFDAVSGRRLLGFTVDKPVTLGATTHTLPTGSTLAGVVVLLDASNAVLVSKLFANAAETKVEACRLAADGSFVVGGSFKGANLQVDGSSYSRFVDAHTDAFLFRFDVSGTKVWHRIWADSQKAWVANIDFLPVSGDILAAGVLKAGSSVATVIRVGKTTGTTAWTREAASSEVLLVRAGPAVGGADGSWTMAGYRWTGGKPVFSGAVETLYGTQSTSSLALFVAKFSAANVAQATTSHVFPYVGGNGWVYASDMALDASGALYLTGELYDANVSMPDGLGGSITVPASGNPEVMFVIKYASNGSVEWARWHAPSVNQWGQSVELVGASQDPVIAAWGEGATWRLVDGTTLAVPSPSKGNILQYLDSDGNLLSTKTFSPSIYFGEAYGGQGLLRYDASSGILDVFATTFQNASDAESNENGAQFVNMDLRPHSKYGYTLFRYRP